MEKERDSSYFICPQYVEHFDPLHEASRNVSVWEIEALHADGKFPLLLSVLRRIVSHSEVVGGLIALVLRQ